MPRRAIASGRRKLQPSLRMIANGSTEVNALRAEHASALTVSESVAERLPRLRAESAKPTDSRVARRDVDRPRLSEAPDARVSAFVRLRQDVTDEARIRSAVGEFTARSASQVTAELAVSEAVALADDPAVALVELGQPLSTPTPVVSDERQRAPTVAQRRFGSERAHGFGKDVLVGIIDVGGFDFSHPDFLDGDGGTRFERIWDQGGSAHDAPGKRGTSGFEYGSEVRKEELDRAIESARAGGLPAYQLEPQSQWGPSSHATHVASIAAGNRGICRAARIAGVLISLPEEDYERRLSFYDSTRIAHAVDYLAELAHELGDLPLSINVSLGTNGHAHDDSSAIARWIDALLTRPGRNVCIAAGNAGQERAEHERDTGYIMGRVHSAGQIRARELVADLEWIVVGNGLVDISENELEVWYGPQDRFAVQVKPPGQPWTDPVEPGQFIENRQLPDQSYLSVYNELYNPANGANYIAVFLSPQLLEAALVGVSAGQWLVRLIGREVRDGRYHCWIERDDPHPRGRIGERDAWNFPSFFSERSFVDSSTVSSLACGQRIVSIANLDEAARAISITSSQGPTRDGRLKPEVAAPGTDIVAANGFAGDDLWVSMSGTSMASPFVAGVVGLMLAINPRLTGAQVGGIIQRTARPLPGTDFAWRDDAGFGQLDPERCLAEAGTMRTLEDVT